MNNNWKDNSTVYLKQQSHFYRWILYPVVLLFFVIAIFLIYGSSEQVIRSKGQLTSNEIVHVQIPIEAPIIKNQLKENLTVKKGDPLITFDLDPLSKQQQQAKEKLSSINQQIQAIDTLVKSFESEQNLFEQSDAYGYSNQINAYLKEKEVVTQATQQIENTYENNLTSTQKKINQLSEQLTKKQNELQEWTQIRAAWLNQQSLQGYTAENMSKYAVWLQQMKQAPETEKEQIKATILAEIDTLISQQKQTIDQLQLEKDGADLPTSPANDIASQKTAIDKTKELQVSVIKEKKQELLLSYEENEATLKNIDYELKNETIYAPSDGVIHLASEYKSMKEIPKGTIVADVYPLLSTTKMTVAAQIPANEMTYVNVGMPIHLKLDKKGISEKILNGKLTEISETSTTTEQGVFYSVKGLVTIPKNTEFRYGLTGDMTFVIGKKTYWKQLKDLLFNQT
ncbi:bacteriocin secretion accessory protein [Enterococcus wangshanyuanii]|uniref:Lactococcin A secretion protein LcnD-like n=1 Tax=Enterococcus wangshanyuanii TaxID=2005703 RepID=A0ABQ1PWD4_9ENTE|nr:bacteriocin secretion accessory protein [Enterococcus wangshanyuanii]GGD05401.1 lactococcin A secretion protein LcnD-like [Enterococcus wangshanyuanii]